MARISSGEISSFFLLHSVTIMVTKKYSDHNGYISITKQYLICLGWLRRRTAPRDLHALIASPGSDSPTGSVILRNRSAGDTGGTRGAPPFRRSDLDRAVGLHATGSGPPVGGLRTRHPSEPLPDSTSRQGTLRPCPEPSAMLPHDAACKLLFSFPAMVRGLLAGFFPREWVEELDLSTLERWPENPVSDDLRQRHQDRVWRVRCCDRWLYVLVMLEFQSTIDHTMAVRILRDRQDNPPIPQLRSPQPLVQRCHQRHNRLRRRILHVDSSRRPAPPRCAVVAQLWRSAARLRTSPSPRSPIALPAGNRIVLP